MYSELTPWYHLIDPVADHEDEAEAYLAGFARAVTGPAETLLELGVGAGNNAYYLKRRYRCTLTDVSEPMLALSRAQNPECEHLPGDMRSLRLGRTFDAVLLHDAIVYMTTEEDLLAAATTACLHTRRGGAAIVAPDFLRDTFHEKTLLIEGEEGTRALRGIEWCWDPDPGDTTYMVEYGFLLREDNSATMVHDRHMEGLFAEADWKRLLGKAGFEVEMIERPVGPGEVDRIFLCRRPLPDH
ncbi:MAG TPA: class I SAM-dependent methyltransferase [Vicinamibacterales bacterium]|nr:class I SAM-dependent methyltransferase [Vicinamibacterales bacterium]